MLTLECKCCPMRPAKWIVAAHKYNYNITEYVLFVFQEATNIRYLFLAVEFCLFRALKIPPTLPRKHGARTHQNVFNNALIYRNLLRITFPSFYIYSSSKSRSVAVQACSSSNLVWSCWRSCPALILTWLLPSQHLCQIAAQYISAISHRLNPCAATFRPLNTILVPNIAYFLLFKSILNSFFSSLCVYQT